MNFKVTRQDMYYMFCNCFFWYANSFKTKVILIQVAIYGNQSFSLDNKNINL